MKKINLGDEYYWCKRDDVIELSEEVAKVFTESKRMKENYERKLRYHKATYSIDTIEDNRKHILFASTTPEELYERKITYQELYGALLLLTEKQRNRILKYFFEEMTETEIADEEGVSIPTISISIKNGLNIIKKILKNLD